MDLVAALGLALAIEGVLMALVPGLVRDGRAFSGRHAFDGASDFRHCGRCCRPGPGLAGARVVVHSRNRSPPACGPVRPRPELSGRDGSGQAHR